MFLRFYLKGCMLTKTYPGDILTYILKYNLEESMFYRFPAMRGIQANSEYFVCMIPLSYTINIQHLLSLVKLLNPRRIHRNVCL